MTSLTTTRTALPPAAHFGAIALAGVALAAIGGGLALIAAPDGSVLSMTSASLAGTPFADYLAPGLILLAANGLLPLLTLLLAWRRRALAPLAMIANGLVIMGFVGAQSALLHSFDPIGTMVPWLVGFGVALAGAYWWRDARAA